MHLSHKPAQVIITKWCSLLVLSHRWGARACQGRNRNGKHRLEEARTASVTGTRKYMSMCNTENVIFFLFHVTRSSNMKQTRWFQTPNPLLPPVCPFPSPCISFYFWSILSPGFKAYYAATMLPHRVLPANLWLYCRSSLITRHTWKC